MLKVAIFTGAARTAILQGVAADRQSHPVTPDGRDFEVRGRLWRMSDPSLDHATPQAHVVELMTARRAVREARSGRGDLAAAPTTVDRAKRALSERGPPWWSDGAPDYNRHMAAITPCATWLATLKPPAPDESDGRPD